MRKKQDIMWEQSTLWEPVEKWGQYLKKNHPEYQQMQSQAIELKTDIRVVYRDGIEKNNMLQFPEFCI